MTTMQDALVKSGVAKHRTHIEIVWRFLKDHPNSYWDKIQAGTGVGYYSVITELIIS